MFRLQAKYSQIKFDFASCWLAPTTVLATRVTLPHPKWFSELEVPSYLRDEDAALEPRSERKRVVLFDSSILDHCRRNLGMAFLANRTLIEPSRAKHYAIRGYRPPIQRVQKRWEPIMQNR